MRYHPGNSRRQGTIVPTLAVCMIFIFALIAFSVDIGLMALARTHLQNAADAGAMSGVRYLNGDQSTNNNYDQAVDASKAIATANKMLNASITSSSVTTEIGYYAHNSSLKRFEPDFSGSKPTGENWTSARVTISATQPMYFAKVFGVSGLTASATATAVHRPRDVAIILDFSGSMKYSCEPAYPSSGTITGSLNPDPAYPKFGHWSSLSSVMQRTTIYSDSGGEAHAPNNLTMDTQNGDAVVRDFLTRDASNALINAFHRPTSPYAPSTWACPAPSDWDTQSDTTATYWNSSGTGLGGDRWPCKSKATTGTTWAATVQEYLFGTNSSSTYTSLTHNKSSTTGGGTGAFDPANPDIPTANEGYGPNFKGYSIGPGYYGKTFYVWPPDPRYQVASTSDVRLRADWRKRFFFNGGSTTALGGNTAGGDNRVDNSRLWNASGLWQQAGSTTYAINYDAILAWINSGPQVLPSNLRAGRVLYYSSIPTTIPSSGGTQDQRFWRDYINYVIGAGSSTVQQQTGYGRSTSAWGTMQVTPKASLQTDSSTRPYMHYNDNPIPPRLQFWFGPLSMLCFLGDNNSSTYGRNWLPGNCHESQCWQLKAGVNSALDDIKKNHPNDWVGLIYFSSVYSTPRVQLGKDYTKMKNALFFPFSQLDNLGNTNAEVRPYNNSYSSTASGEIPNANGSTCPEIAFKMAYNEFSGRSGFNGRRGATKMVIFETDGVPNTAETSSTANSNLQLGSPPAYNSYYSPLTNGSNVGNNNSTVLSRAKTVAQTICALDTATNPGYATTKNPVRIHAIAFGDLFQTTSQAKTDALAFLLDIQKIGGTQPTTATSFDSSKIITGDFNTRINTLRDAFERIMQSGVQVTLIR